MNYRHLDGVLSSHCNSKAGEMDPRIEHTSADAQINQWNGKHKNHHDHCTQHSRQWQDVKDCSMARNKSSCVDADKDGLDWEKEHHTPNQPIPYQRIQSWIYPTMKVQEMSNAHDRMLLKPEKGMHMNRYHHCFHRLDRLQWVSSSLGVLTSMDRCLYRRRGWMEW